MSNTHCQLFFGGRNLLRLDLFLKASRIVLRRSVARQLCDSRRIVVNGLAAKASKEIKVGDEIEIRRGTRKTVVKVTDIPHSKQVSKQAAESLIKTLSDERQPDPLLP